MRNNLPLLAFIVLVLPLCRLADAAPGDMELVKDGASAFVIVHSEKAPLSVRQAAGELQAYIEKSTGAKLPVIVGRAPAERAFIALGDTAEAREAGISAGGVPLEGFRRTSKGGNLFILGPDTPDFELTSEGGTSKGTLNGVYTFIEDALDVRWLLPGPLGEDVPLKKDVTLPAVDRTEGPAFSNRRLPGMQSEQRTVKQWSARQKLGFSMRLQHAHFWKEVVPASLHAQHPDWFPEVDGQRPPVVGDRYKLETTNPGLIQHYAEVAMDAFRKDPKLPVFSLSPTDSAGWSTSAESRALYDTDPRGRVSYTPLVLKFYNDVAKIVGKEFPDRKLAGYVYARYLFPPTAGIPPLEPNLFLVVAPSISYGYQLYREGVKEEWEGIVSAWAGKTSQIAYYDLFNWLMGSGGAITPPAPEILNFAFPRLLKHGMKGVYLYGSPEWSQAAVNNYVLAKMAWNPGLDADALCDEFYRRAFGADAAESVREIYHLVDAAVKVLYNEDETANYTATPRYQSEVLAVNYPRIEALYLEAQKAAAAQATPGQKARLEFFGDNLVLMQSQLRAAGFLPEMKSSPLYRPATEVEKMLGRMHPGFGVALAPGMKRMEKPFPPVQVAWGAALPNARPVTQARLRGKTRFLVFPNADQEVSVMITKVTKPDATVRYDAYSASGTKIGGAMLQPGAPERFLGSAGQIYYVELDAGMVAYEMELKGAPWALAADAEARGVHFCGHTTPLYFQVPAGMSEFSLSVSSSSPGETSLGKLYAPDGKLVHTFDTQTTPVAKAMISTQQAGAGGGGFWCLSVEKAPQGGFDDVYVVLDAPLPQWFTLDAAVPLTITNLKSVE